MRAASPSWGSGVFSKGEDYQGLALVSLSGMVETPRLQAKTDIECRNATLQDRCSYKDRYEGTYNLDTEISEEGIKWRSSNESPGSIKADSI